MSLFRTHTYSGEECGHCKGCRWWQAEHEEAELATGLCMQPELTHFSVQVTADSGCNRFAAVESAELAVSGV